MELCVHRLWNEGLREFIHVCSLFLFKSLNNAMEKQVGVGLKALKEVGLVKVWNTREAKQLNGFSLSDP